MVARVRTVAFQGIDVLDVDTQVTITGGLPVFAVVGLPDKAVAESRERVRAALATLGLALPPKRITVNLAPADLAKEGKLLTYCVYIHGLNQPVVSRPMARITADIVFRELCPAAARHHSLHHQ